VGNKYLINTDYVDNNKIVKISNKYKYGY